MKQVHGGDVYRHKNVIDFSSNTNPYGPPKAVIEAAKKSLEKMEHYPDIFCSELRESLSKQEEISPDSIIFGNGAADLIFALAWALKPKKALLQTPTFVEYEQALTSVGCEITYLETNEENEFRVGEEILEHITKELDILFLCNPNNPTGLLIEPELMQKICKACEENQVYFILDECFNDFIEEQKFYTMKPELMKNQYLFILKAFTKLYAMAGMRLGYGLCENKNLLERMHQVTQPWRVSIPAQAAGVAALEQKEYVAKSRELICTQREWLKVRMQELGYQVWDSKANYIFFKGQKDLYEKCLERGILIRDCGNYRGLGAGYYRIAVKLPDENKKLIEVLEEVILWQKQL